jgi:Protein of unknown function (DUF2891)
LSEAKGIGLQGALALRIAPVVLANITRRYPYHDTHLFREGEKAFEPWSAHPAFANSFDWHSSVHSHWTAIKLLEHGAIDQAQPHIAGRLRRAVTANLTPASIAAEEAYLAERPTYERPYGWAWTLRLAACVQTASLPELGSIRSSLRRVAECIANHAALWLRQLPAPVRHGVHSNTAFALSLMFDASGKLRLRELAADIERRSYEWFGDDRNYPQAWERSGNDFLSPGLAEADLMRAIFGAERFEQWWSAFLPRLAADSQIVAVVKVPKVADGGIAHLHGLNLSRAGVLARIAATLLDLSEGRPQLRGAFRQLLAGAEALYAASVDEAVIGDYLSTHWLATFAWDAALSIDSAWQNRGSMLA